MAADQPPADQLPPDGSPSGWVGWWAERTPAAPAVIGRRTLTYAELDERCRSVAGMLAARGAGAERVIGVLAPRGIDFVVAAVAVLDAGAAYLPLEPEHPDLRLGAMVRAAGAALVLCSGAQLDRAAAFGANAVRIADGVADDAGRATRAPAAIATAANLAYVMPTSGTSGVPKLVGVSRGALYAHAETTAGAYRLTPRDRVLQFASVGFDVAAEEIFPTLHAGGCVVVQPPTAMAPSPFEGHLDDHAVTVVNLPARFWQGWVDDLVTGGRRPPASLRLVVVGSEPVAAAAVARWQRHTAVPLVVAYGVTEGTITSTLHQVGPRAAGSPSAAAGTPAATAPAASAPVGRPLAGTRALVLDGWLAPVPVGEVGELYVGGAGLARGYVGRPDLTAERFVPDPSGRGDRLYRTGDRARTRPDGTLDLVGRVDDQLKIAGHRIEPHEVSEAIAAHPDVAAAYVTGHDHGRQIAAYLVPRDPGRVPSAPQLRAALCRTLPTYMLPHVYVVVSALPLTPQGKVDRHALPAPTVGRLAVATAYREPAGDLERGLAEIWAVVLGADRIGAGDHFLDLGGSSLLAVMIAARVRDRFGVDLVERDLLDHPTVGGLARHVATLGAARQGSLPPLRPRRHGRRVPVSAIQEQVWFLDRLSPTNPAYQAQTSIRVAGPLDLDVLDLAVTELVRRHEILRTTFEEADGAVLQVVHDPYPVRLDRFDLRGLPRAARDAALGELLRGELARPFDLGALPLARWSVVRTAEDDWEILLVEHHLVHDGWSFTLLMKELTTAYLALVDGRAPSLPEVGLQYRDFAAWQLDALESAAMRAQRDYWRAALAGEPPGPALPMDRPRRPAQRFRGGVARRDLPTELVAALQTLCRAEGTTLFMALLAAYAATLHRCAGARDLWIGSGFGNRRRRELEGLVGMLVNAVVLRVAADGQLPFRELLRRVRHAVLGASANQEHPFSRLVRELNPARDISRNPLFQTMFSVDDSPSADLDFGGSPATVIELHNGSAKVDLNVLVVPRGQRLRGQRLRGDVQRADGRISFLWEYDSDLFDEATIERLADRYERLLAAAVAEPSLTLDRLPFRSAREEDTGRPPRPLPVFAPVQPEQAAEPTPAQVATSAPTPEELALCEIWAEVLDLGSVERDDDFFELGGHSLLALQVVSRIRARLGCAVPVATLFDHPTVAQLGAVLQSMRGQGGDLSPASADFLVRRSAQA